jgi:glycosyltransferase involved in cell wall biosynthesis
MKLSDKKILVSTIIPTYKRADLLSRAIDSVLNQTYQNIEVIIVDDNDPDTEFRKETELLMSKYLNDKRIIYIKHPRNKNGAAARNTGISCSNGEVICFLDDDDWFVPLKIERQLSSLLENQSYQGVYCGRFQNGTIIKSKLSGDLSKAILLSEFIPGPPTLMIYKKCLKAIGGFNESYLRHQDSEILLRYFKQFKLFPVEDPLVYIGVNLAENEVHGTALENLKKTFFDEFKPIIDEIDSKNKDFRKNVISKHYSNVFFDHLQHGYYRLAAGILIKHLGNAPLLFSKYLFLHFFGWIQYKLGLYKKLDA